MGINEKLMRIQTQIKAPKNLYNSFGKYKYRNAEGICEAVKPFLEKENVSLILLDDVMAVGNRFYVKAIARLTDNENGDSVEATAFARESETKKGMDDSQITGTASSYARKYALNGLFLLDDTKDADTMDNTEKPKAAPKAKAKTEQGNKDMLIHSIATMAKELGANSEDLKEVMRRHFDKGASSELTDSEAAEMEKNFVAWVAEVKDDDNALMEGIE